jgi:lysozyme family protein
MTQKYFSAWCIKKGLPLCDVYKATFQQASDFCYDEYYVQSGAVVLLGDMNFVLLQMAYNIGNYEAIKILQQVLNINQDGIFGPVTKKMANDSQIHVTIRKMLIAQEAFYKKIENPAEQVDKDGWDNRVKRTANIVDVSIK